MHETTLVDPDHQPMTDVFVPAHRLAFHRAVEAYYAANYPSSGPVVVAADFRRHVHVDVGASLPAGHGFTDPGATGLARVVGLGVHRVYQISNPVEASRALGWVWFADAPDPREIWLLMKFDMLNTTFPYFHRLGPGHPDCRLWFEFAQAAPPAWDLVGDEAGALADFEAWVRANHPHAALAAFQLQDFQVLDE
jgi:hypothetical protein